MENVVLIVVFLLLAAFGFLVVGKLDLALEKEQYAFQQNSWCGPSLRMAFSVPTVSGAVSDALAALSRQHPTAQVSLYAGKEPAVLKKLQEGKVDVAVVAEPIQAYLGWGMYATSLVQTALLTRDQALTLLPVEPGAIPQRIFWQKGTENSLALEFIENLSCPGKNRGHKMAKNLL